ncbi:unnamed protein product [Phytophthora fragariaefolia]|uniref:Unnamed protein product n=1 Tax=Phytophthora fragariaefolia TaxID=1490495 RepID=A0A9W6XTY9_9STRA|nr:unnamed protein product [Phytophthora fragariaefolia]
MCLDPSANVSMYPLSGLCSTSFEASLVSPNPHPESRTQESLVRASLRFKRNRYKDLTVSSSIIAILSIPLTVSAIALGPSCCDMITLPALTGTSNCSIGSSMSMVSNVPDGGVTDTVRLAGCSNSTVALGD